jgi:hypothetical protein
MTTFVLAELPPSYDEFLATWRSSTLDGPPVIMSEEELAAAEPFITPVLFGDLGSMLFQIAGTCVIAKPHGLRCVIAWWNQEVCDQDHLPFGGRGGPAPGITLKHVFPHLDYVGFNPATRSESLGSGSKHFKAPYDASKGFAFACFDLLVD